MATHTADVQTLGAIESALRQAAAAGIVADADFATDKATTLANIVSRNAKAHTSLVPLVEKTKWAVTKGFEILGVTTMITDLATIYAAIEQNWAPGMEM